MMLIEKARAGSNHTIGLSWGLIRFSYSGVYRHNKANNYYLDYNNTNLKGFNGMEKDNEIVGEGKDYDYGARIYDGRLGRWLSLDPAMTLYPSISPYSFVLSNPIYNLDINGEYVTGNIFQFYQEMSAILAGVDGTDVFLKLIVPARDAMRLKTISQEDFAAALTAL